MCYAQQYVKGHLGITYQVIHHTQCAKVSLVEYRIVRQRVNFTVAHFVLYAVRGSGSSLTKLIGKYYHIGSTIDWKLNRGHIKEVKIFHLS